MKRNIILNLVLCALILSACAPTSLDNSTLKIMTHDSFAVSEEVVQSFEAEHGITLQFIKSGDTGAALNRAILTRKNPQADVFYGVDNTFLSRAIEADIFEKYTSPALEQVAVEFKANTEGWVTPIDYGDVCINYDRAYFAVKGLDVPTGLLDLLKSEYGKSEGVEGLLVVENPATSSPGLAFLLATIAEFGEDGYLEFWRELKANGVVVVNDWEAAYYTNFSASSGQGLQPMVVSYATSPAAEVLYADDPAAGAPTASVLGPNTCFRQVEYAGILKGTKQRELAEQFIDFMLGVQFQEDMPLQMFVYPVNPAAVIPVVFEQYAQPPESPASLDPGLIAANRDRWIREWTDLMLK